MVVLTSKLFLYRAREFGTSRQRFKVTWSNWSIKCVNKAEEKRVVVLWGGSDGDNNNNNNNPNGSVSIVLDVQQDKWLPVERTNIQADEPPPPSCHGTNNDVLVHSSTLRSFPAPTLSSLAVAKTWSARKQVDTLWQNF